ncbi:MAG: hypothetical protein JXA20_03270 [Spirochaetes bacterium]|nr:hypothetical protein [Spirochaetota bacterium]
MQFFLLILFNIFMGAILYLVISLKLERSATEFRSQRLRKEMDEVIKEFNATAERNITILENRITVLQRMLVRSGQLKSLDISIDDQGIERSSPAGGIVPAEEPAPAEPSAREGGEGRHEDEPVPSLSQLLVGRVRHGMNSLLDRIERRQPSRAATPLPGAPEDPGERTAETAVDAAPRTEPAPAVETVLLDEDEIRQMIRSADNRYDAISDLHRQGYSLETLSRCSGIPAGEISLVLNLNSARAN